MCLLLPQRAQPRPTLLHRVLGVLERVSHVPPLAGIAAVRLLPTLAVGLALCTPASLSLSLSLWLQHSYSR